uniref:Uncharacterized protein n=1 Tax=Parascaris univalens TaxID=6257 RepID=A0A915CG34_PARUN
MDKRAPYKSRCLRREPFFDRECFCCYSNSFTLLRGMRCSRAGPVHLEMLQTYRISRDLKHVNWWHCLSGTKSILSSRWRERAEEGVGSEER